MFVEGREDLFGGFGSAFPGGGPFADVVFQRDNAFVDAAFEQFIDVASRRVKAAAFASSAQTSTARLLFGIGRH
jgi:hypothetical protein